MTTATVGTPDRELTAERLLRASAERSYDPLVEVDWDAPLRPDTFFIPERRVSLYGTPMWQQMSRAQRIDLSRHEAASVASVGIWFEVILMNLLSRHVYREDVTSRHVHFAFTELADECRHSIMFGRFVDKLGAPAYGPGRLLHAASRAMFVAPLTASTWAAVLIAEELTDTLQRESMNDETVQPLTRQINRIHVVEEARHVRWAREELARVVARTPPHRLAVERFRTAMIAKHTSAALVHPQVYAAVGLDVAEAQRQVAASPHRAETLRWMATRLVEFLRGQHLIGGRTERVWRAARLV